MGSGIVISLFTNVELTTSTPVPLNVGAGGFSTIYPEPARNWSCGETV